MKQPPGFKDPTNPRHVWNFKKVLYKLKQEPRAWFNKLTRSLTKLGFTHSKAKQSMFFLLHNDYPLTIVLAYVNHIIITS